MSNDQKTPFEILEEELGGWLSADQLRTLRKNEAAGGTLADFSTAIKKAHRQNLDPLQDHVFFLANYDKNKGREVLSLGISIAGLRSIAQSTGEYAGQKGYFWCGPDGQWTDVWLKDEPPAAAKVGVLRQSFKEPLWNVARWDDYCPKNNKGNPMFMWADMGPHMLGKCCEANALRRAFPDRVSELYIPEEMDKKRSDSVSSSESAPEKTDETLDQLRQATGQAPPQPTGSQPSDADGRQEPQQEDTEDAQAPGGGQPGPPAESDADSDGPGSPPQGVGNEGSANGPGRTDASGEAVGRVSGESGADRAQGAEGSQSTGKPPGSQRGGQEAPEQADTISTGEGSQLNYLFAVGHHEGPYTKDGLKEMVEQEFGVPSIDELPRDKFDAAKERLGNEQLATRYNKAASGKAGTGALPFDEEEGEKPDDGEVHVECPYCGAQKGEPCRTDEGEPVDYYHKDREERFKMQAGDTDAYISQMEKALDQKEGAEQVLEVIRAIAVDIATWPEEDWEEVVSRLEHFHEDARQECDMRRTPEFE